MQTLDLRTGEVTEGVALWAILPPDTSGGKCSECAVLHEPDAPHNCQSLAYQYGFRARKGRRPTWADAMAHCSPTVQAKWKAELIRLGAWQPREP